VEARPRRCARGELWRPRAEMTSAKQARATRFVAGPAVRSGVGIRRRLGLGTTSSARPDHAAA
jgi:hypothetical protein